MLPQPLLVSREWVFPRKEARAVPDPIYEVIAQGARYWFLFLMALIAWRSWRWYRKDKRQAKKRLKLLPDAGFVGEMVVIQSEGTLPRGAVLAVPREGTLGALRTNDLCLPGAGVAKRHLWFRFEDGRGLLVEPFGNNAATVDGEEAARRGQTLCMAHGSWLLVGPYTLRLRLFAGFESTGRAAREPGVEAEPEPQAQPDSSNPYLAAQQQAQPGAVDPYLAAQQQEWLRQQWLMQQAYQLGYEQAMREPPEAERMPETERMPEAEPEEELPEDVLPYDVARIAQQEGLADHSVFMRPRGAARPVVHEEPPAVETSFASPQTDAGEDAWADLPDPDEDVQLYDEDMTDAAAPPKSAYVGHDEAERAKKHVWDKYFGGRG